MLIRVSTKNGLSVTKAEVRGLSGDGVFFVGEPQDLTGLTLQQLAALYNQFTAGDPVKKFADRPTGIQRTWAVIAPTLAAANGSAPSAAEAEAVAAAAEATSPQTQEQTMSKTATKGKKATKATKKANGDAPASRLGEDTLAMVISVKAEKNPKREGTEAHTRFKLYKDGMTVAEFVKKGGSVRDLRWDQAHNHIALKKA